MSAILERPLEINPILLNTNYSVVMHNLNENQRILISEIESIKNSVATLSDKINTIETNQKQEIENIHNNIKEIKTDRRIRGKKKIFSPPEIPKPYYKHCGYCRTPITYIACASDIDFRKWVFDSVCYLSHLMKRPSYEIWHDLYNKTDVNGKSQYKGKSLKTMVDSIDDRWVLTLALLRLYNRYDRKYSELIEEKSQCFPPGAELKKFKKG